MSAAGVPSPIAPSGISGYITANPYILAQCRNEHHIIPSLVSENSVRACLLYEVQRHMCSSKLYFWNHQKARKLVEIYLRLGLGPQTDHFTSGLKTSNSQNEILLSLAQVRCNITYTLTFVIHDLYCPRPSSGYQTPFQRHP